jgi:alpha-methylacyl-CoA racemase
MGPLAGVKVVEIAGIGPGPFCATVIGDMGAEVIRVDRLVPGAVDEPEAVPVDFVLRRSRRSIAVDLKNPSGVETVLRLAETADALIEGFRPGVAERLGVGPEHCMERNRRLVYGRITGFGQDGPLAQKVGHDINYVAIAGALHPIGRADSPPVPPLNLVGDFGGGGMLLAFGVVCALFETKRSGLGQVVDAAMVDGSALLMSMIYGMRSLEFWSDQRGANLVDGGAPFYDVYETADQKYVAVGAIEEPFYGQLLHALGLSPSDLPAQMDRDRWPEVKTRFTDIFRTRTRGEWCEKFEGTDACISPVLTMGEALEYPHNVARSTFLDVNGTVQPAPAPRFSRTAPAVSRPPARTGEHTDEVLMEWGFSAEEIAELRGAGAVG